MQIIAKYFNRLIFIANFLFSYYNSKIFFLILCLLGIMALDVLIRHKPSMMHVTHKNDEIMYATVGRSFYTNQISQSLYGGAEVWQGYYQSARPAPKKMMINVDVSATAFYESGSLVQMVVKLLGKRHPDDLRRGIPDRDRVKLEKALKNVKIRV